MVVVLGQSVNLFNQFLANPVSPSRDALQRELTNHLHPLTLSPPLLSPPCSHQFVASRRARDPPPV
eukprot:757436-Hanusia_phi.AAC.18